MENFNHALVTGASRGLGRQIAYLLSSQVKKITIAGRDQNALDETRNHLKNKLKFSGDVDIWKVDLSDRLFFEKAENLPKGVDLLINNAGLGFCNKIEKMNWSEMQKMISVNVESLTFLAWHYAQSMKSNGRGMVLNISSVGSYIPMPYFSVYSGTKSYVTNFSVAMNEELSGTGVKVKVLHPGGINTDFVYRSGLQKSILVVNKKFIASPEYVAQKALKLINSSSAIGTDSFVNQILILLSGLISKKSLAHSTEKIYSQFLPNSK